MQPHPDAEGPHSVFRRGASGQINKYETYRWAANHRNPDRWVRVKRFDRTGRAHYNKQTGRSIGTPHVHDPEAPGGVRPPRSDEVPG
jgi:Bacterial toxin 24